MAIFDSSFSNLDPKKISNSIKTNGFFFHPKALTKQELSVLLNEINLYDLNLNNPDVGKLIFNNQIFFPNILAASKKIVDITLSPFLHKICNNFFKKKSYRLKCLRYYESKYNYVLGWHVDNKTVNNIKTKTRGLVFIFYLNDTFDGFLKVINKSNKFSKNDNRTEYDDEEIKKNKNYNVSNFPGPAGSVIITDISSIHRVKTIKDKCFIKKSLFIQIDDDMNHSEKIILSPHYFPKSLNKKMLQFFGFGLNSGYLTQPNSSLNTYKSKDILILMVRLLTILFKKLFLSLRHIWKKMF